MKEKNIRNDLMVTDQVPGMRKIRNLKPAYATDIIMITIPTPHEMMRMLFSEVQDLRSSMDILTRSIGRSNRKQAIKPAFMKTDEMANYLSVSKSFLEKNIDIIFTMGVHYNKSDDARLLRWNVEAMYEWMKGGKNEFNNMLSEKLFKNI